jgi:acyl-CoA synthetase (AMP-forming)/AMP-acid ligase II/pyrroloquinoline quinone (PQQ) biosynthesis protein C
MTALADAIARHAAGRPHAVAIDGGSLGQLTWLGLERALAAAVALVDRDLGGGSAVALRLDQGPAACLLDLALVEARIASVPLPPFFTAEQSARAMGAAGCARLIRSAMLDCSTGQLELTAELVEASAVALLPGTSKVSFTSGSTGDPKGICLSSDHLLSVAQGVVDTLGVAHAGRHLPILPPAVLLENVAGFYASILAGGTYVALPQAEIGFANPFRPDIAQALGTVQRRGITSLILVPEYLAGLVMAMEASGMRLPLLTLVAVGGARVSVDLLDRAAALGLPVRQGYGLTECGSVVALERGDEAARGSVGHAVGSSRVHIADDGEIIVEGPAFLGTIGRPRAPGPLSTGDLGRLTPAGELVIEGRKSNLIVTSFGRNISPEWVEAALVAQPEIAQAMVRGDGNASLDALIVPAACDADIAAAINGANASLPAYARVEQWKLVPPFTPMNAMLTGNGRLRRADIASAYPERLDTMPFYDQLVADTREAQARFLAVPQLQAGFAGRISLAVYLDYLTQAYHHVCHTVPLMREARARLGHRPELVAALDEYITEETGHEQWILDDIDAAGGDGGTASCSAPSPGTAAMVAHAYDVVRTGNPAAFFGMVYVLEGTSVAMASGGAEAVRRSLGLPERAFRYLTSHGAVDAEHLKFFERTMNRIDDPADQAAIIAMARDMFGLFGNLFAGIDLEMSREAA